jgi:outer membrane protein OmpA-like peptidoglycan-associated protein
MTIQIGIEIDGNKIAWVQSSEQQGSVLTKLTTITEHQSTAIIHIYIKTPENKKLLCTETINGITSRQGAPPAIDVLTKISRNHLHYRISLNGRIFTENQRKIGNNRQWLPFVIILLFVAAAAAALLFIFLPGRSGRPPDDSQNRQTQEIKEVQPPPSPPEQKKDAIIAEPIAEKEPEAPTPVLENEPVVSWYESEIFDKYSVFFSPDSAALTNTALSNLSTFISSLPAGDDFEEGFFELAVRGHCAKYGTEEGREDLSRERALNVTNFLRNKWGIEADYTTSGAGASEPVSLAQDEQHLNRRVDIDIKGNIRNKIVTKD